MDIIYTFVDGSDEIWTQKRQNAFDSHFNKAINNIDSNSANRFRNRNELKYSLRSVEKYLPWVRNIFLVTDNQIPSWLNVDNPKIKIIDHRDIIDQEFLPTFNSHAIEANLYKIPNISEFFWYFNDDIFLNREIDLSSVVVSHNSPSTTEDTKSSSIIGWQGQLKMSSVVKSSLLTTEDTKIKIKINLDPNYTKRGKPSVNEIGYRSAWKNTNNWLDKRYVKENRKKMAHCPSTISVSLMKELWEKMEKELTLTTSRKFRSITDYNVTCALFPYYCLYEGKAEIGDLKCLTLYLDGNKENTEKELEKLGDCDIFCLEDGSEISDDEDAIVSFLEMKFPNKSEFEK